MRKFAGLPPRFWLERDGQQIAKLGGQHVALAAYLLTGPNSSVAGIYPVFLPEVAARLHVTTERAEALVEDLVRLGWLDFCEVTSTVWIKGTGNVNDQLGTTDFRRNPKWLAMTERYLSTLPASRLVDAFRRQYGLAVDPEAIPYRYPTDTPPIGPFSSSVSDMSPSPPDAGRRGGAK